MVSDKIKKYIEGSVCIGLVMTLCYASSLTWLMLLMIKMISCYYRKQFKNTRNEKLYGLMKYERVCNKSCYWMILLPILQLFILFLNFKLFLNYDYNIEFFLLLLLIESLILYISYKCNFKIYAQGILYNKDFYTFEQLKHLVLVKNYNDEYEYYKSYTKKVLTLTENEMNYLN